MTAPNGAIPSQVELVPTAEGAVYAVAVQDPAVLGLLGQRVYRNAATEGSETPYAVLTRIDGVRGQLMGGSDGIVTSRIQLDLYDTDEIRLAKASEALRLALDSFRGNAAGLDVRRIHLTDAASDAVRAADGSDVLIHRNRMDFVVTYLETRTALPSGV